MGRRDERSAAERRLEELSAGPRPDAPQRGARAAPEAKKRPGLLRRTGTGIRRFYRVWIQSDTEDRNPSVSDVVLRDNDPWN